MTTDKMLGFPDSTDDYHQDFLSLIGLPQPEQAETALCDMSMFDQRVINPSPGEIQRAFDQRSAEVPPTASPFRLNAQDCFLVSSSIDHATPYASSYVNHRISGIPMVFVPVPSVSMGNPYLHRFLPPKPLFLAPPIRNTQVSSAPEKCISAKPAPIVSPKLELQSPVSTTVSGGQVCSHCSTDATSLWRRVDGRLMCNACALYLKLHKTDRPLHLNTGVVKKRNRVGTTKRRRRRHNC